MFFLCQDIAQFIISSQCQLCASVKKNKKNCWMGELMILPELLWPFTTSAEESVTRLSEFTLSSATCCSKDAIIPHGVHWRLLWNTQRRRERLGGEDYTLSSTYSHISFNRVFKTLKCTWKQYTQVFCYFWGPFIIIYIHSSIFSTSAQTVLSDIRPLGISTRMQRNL